MCNCTSPMARREAGISGLGDWLSSWLGGQETNVGQSVGAAVGANLPAAGRALGDSIGPYVLASAVIVGGAIVAVAVLRR